MGEGGSLGCLLRTRKRFLFLTLWAWCQIFAINAEVHIHDITAMLLQSTSNQRMLKWLGTTSASLMTLALGFLFALLGFFLTLFLFNFFCLEKKTDNNNWIAKKISTYWVGNVPNPSWPILDFNRGGSRPPLLTAKLCKFSPLSGYISHSAPSFYKFRYSASSFYKSCICPCSKYAVLWYSSKYLQGTKRSSFMALTLGHILLKRKKKNGPNSMQSKRSRPFHFIQRDWDLTFSFK